MKRPRVPFINCKTVSGRNHLVNDNIEIHDHLRARDVENCARRLRRRGGSGGNGAQVSRRGADGAVLFAKFFFIAARKREFSLRYEEPITLMNLRNTISVRILDVAPTSGAEEHARGFSRYCNARRKVESVSLGRHDLIVLQMFQLREAFVNTNSENEVQL